MPENATENAIETATENVQPRPSYGEPSAPVESSRPISSSSRGAKSERARSLRSWALHGLVLAGAVGSVAVDRRVRKSRYVAALPPFTPFVTAGAYMAVLRAVEQRHPHDEAWRPSKSETRTDLACVSAGVVAASVGNALGDSLAVACGAKGRADVSRFPTPVGTAISILAFDLVHSRFHQLLHVWGPGWRFHAMHHGANRLYWLNAGKTQVVEFALDGFFEGFVTQLLGLSRDQLVAHQAVRAMYGNLEHCNIDLRSGVLDHVFSTPDLHRWHHSTVYEEGDSNYGVVTSIWDRLFGTWYRPNDREVPEELGVGRMPDFPTAFVELERVPFDWPKIRQRNAATWNEPEQSTQVVAGRP